MRSRAKNETPNQKEDFVFVFEFKLDKTAEIALAQIKERDYFRRYVNSGKKIFLVGVKFAPEAGRIAVLSLRSV